MRDFPPPVSTYTGDAPQRPDARSPRHLLWWLVRQQGDLLAAASVFSVLWMLPTALTPWVFGQAVDEGIQTGDARQVVGWLAVLLLITVLGASSGIFYHTVVVRSWLVALYGTTSHVTHQSVALGHVLPRRSPTGEVLSVSGSDGDQFGGFMEILSRAIGNLVAYAVVALIVLSVSLELGLVVLLVAPLLVLTSAPLLRPMGRAQTQERSRDSELTSLATDIVAGLRILRGIGGERIFGDNYASQSQRVRVAGVRAGLWQAIVEAVGVLFSGLFVVALMWLGVRELLQGRLTIGELIAFLGYALFLVQPIRVFFEFAQKVTRARVSARKAITVLGQPYPWPSTRQTEGTSAAPAPGSATASAPGGEATTAAAPALSGNAELYDVASGLRVAPGVLTMVVSAVPDESAALADRLGRYLPGGPEPTPLDPGEELTGRAAREARGAAEQQRRDLIGRDAQRASSAWRVSLGGVDLADADIARVRETILVSDTGAHVFAGTLQQAVDPHGRLPRQEAEQALHAAAAEDVYDILPGGWQGVLDERGRGLSGGQRQRLVLTRALAADPPILVLVEPTSAVDAHTEARIAQRLPAARAGRTTVVMTASPLLLHHADDIALLVDGQVRATGTHEELMASSTAYRRVVIRGDDRRVDDMDTAPGASHEKVTRP